MSDKNGGKYLIAGDGKYFLKQGLNEGVDFEPMSAVVFQRLVKHYGVENTERDTIERTVEAKNGKPYLEIYPRCVTVRMRSLIGMCISIDYSCRCPAISHSHTFYD